MRLTIIPSSKYIAVDGEGLLKIQQDLSWIPSNVHAVQWYDTWGEIEYNGGSPNERIEELGIFEQAVEDYNNEKHGIQDELDAFEASRDYREEMRVLRNARLVECDWTQSPDSPLTAEKKEEWAIYRQNLRDLTESIVDPKPLVLDQNHTSWPTKPA